MSTTITISHRNVTNFETLTESPNNVANQTNFDLWALEAARLFYLFYTPLLVGLGSIGNLASVFVFYSSKLRLQSTSQYLSALAVSDTVFLLQLLAPWFSAAQITDLFYKMGFCQIFVYISYVTCCLSAWLVVAFTMERFVAVVYPLQRNQLCTLTRARIVIASLTITSIGLNVPVLQFALPAIDSCQIDKEYLDHAAKFNMVDTVISFTAPLALIIMLNTFIMTVVCRLERARQHLDQRGRSTGLLGCPRSQLRITRMLLIVSSVFIVLNLPAYTFRILAYTYDMNSDEIGGRWTALQQLSGMFFNTNFGINFILYCLSGKNFRDALIQAVPCKRHRALRAVTVERVTSNPARADSISTSFGSNTEATNAAVTVVPTHRRRPEHFITRWTFDNSRQGRNQPGLSTSVTFGSNTEATNAAANVFPTRRRQPEHYIKRWTFDNNRQRCNQPGPSSSGTPSNIEHIEMRQLRNV